MRTSFPSVGQIVRVRSRSWLVEDMQLDPGYGSSIQLACLDDDAQGELLTVNWDLELDARIVSEESWRKIGSKCQNRGQKNRVKIGVSGQKSKNSGDHPSEFDFCTLTPIPFV